MSLTEKWTFPDGTHKTNVREFPLTPREAKRKARRERAKNRQEYTSRKNRGAFRWTQRQLVNRFRVFVGGAAVMLADDSIAWLVREARRKFKAPASR